MITATQVPLTTDYWRGDVQLFELSDSVQNPSVPGTMIRYVAVSSVDDAVVRETYVFAASPSGEPLRPMIELAGSSKTPGCHTTAIGEFLAWVNSQDETVNRWLGETEANNLLGRIADVFVEGTSSDGWDIGIMEDVAQLLVDAGFNIEPEDDDDER